MSYPIVMVKGDANTPQRFWTTRLVENHQEHEDSRELGFILSSNQDLGQFKGYEKRSE